ncbi:Drug Metabolite transporter superfamily [Chlorella sorokiniana]|uniref:Drug Metabolite transporter superfamily n=1 Tax=Chlorella sorokiniana TaxID=3076 RepID=A0A2P6TP90_CHLSO|nr:Drug Metabolite transporter superfamily [Chlorella sorokiniana]|eukprot:PRW51150.1 Drug Metabolite transporter superfamily [Chlorella sorokiniana]
MQQQQLQQQGTPAVGSGGAASSGLLLLGLPAAVLAGLEIGSYNCIGSFAQIAGLSYTTATRGAFLVQASTLFTPALSALAGMPPSRRAWLGSCLALAGTLVIAADQSGGSTAAAAGEAAVAASSLRLGDALTLLAALCYSAACVRLPAWAVQRGVRPLQLALGKATFLTVVALAALGLQLAAGQPAAQLWPGWQRPEGWAVVVWAALGPGALASVLHVKGQSLVPPTAAQIVFCSVPLWSVLLAAAVLPGEAVGSATLLGGAVVAAAGLVAALPAAGERRESSAAER